MSLLDPNVGLLPVFLLLCILAYVFTAWFGSTGAASITEPVKKPPTAPAESDNDHFSKIS